VSQMLAIDGRPLGRRAQLTRRRLLDATCALLESNGIRDVRVVEVARKVGTSPATFYQYFRSVDEAVLALADELAEELHPLAELLDRPWNGKGGLDAARTMVDGYFRYWDRHRAIMRVRNLAADEGDRRFRDVRNRALSTLTDRIASAVADNQRAGRVAPEITPYSAAAAMVAMMERMATYHFDLEPRGVRRGELVETTARILHSTITGRKA
jgi:AcrR family transcriptional regulator